MGCWKLWMHASISVGKLKSGIESCWVRHQEILSLQNQAVPFYYLCCSYRNIIWKKYFWKLDHAVCLAWLSFVNATWQFENTSNCQIVWSIFYYRAALDWITGFAATKTAFRNADLSEWVVEILVLLTTYCFVSLLRCLATQASLIKSCLSQLWSLMSDYCAPLYSPRLLSCCSTSQGENLVNKVLSLGLLLC